MGATRASWGSFRPLGLAVAVLLAAGGAHGQTTWTKYVGNPVLPAGDAGTWDSLVASITAVLVEGGTYRAWYWGYQTLASITIGYATSPDGVTWTRYAGNPVLGPTGPAWEVNQVAFPMVVLDRGLYHMWYSGNANNPKIGHAVSADGILWTPQPADQPVLRPTSGSWDRWGISSSRVVLLGETAHMWYTGVGPDDVFAEGYASGPLPFVDVPLFADDFETGDTSAWSLTAL
jgi:predicted GH43/DUF377 family glycosyl hydrolase